jgi:hypothetical protein
MGDGVGALFEPLTGGEETTNARGLAEAILETIELADRPGTRERCRAHAERFTWQVWGPRFEHLYTS